MEIDPNINYFLAFEHRVRDSYKRAVRQLTRIQKSRSNQEVIELSLTIWFLQLAFFRKVFNKLPMVKRAEFRFNNYIIVASDKLQKSVEMFCSMGRFQANLMVSTQVMEFLRKAISSVKETLFKTWDASLTQLRYKAVQTLLFIQKGRWRLSSDCFCI